VSPTAVPERLDRRQRRRLETIDEALHVALQVMAEQGVAGLSLGEVARRMGIRPPSLYVYFDSKNALYDAIFARGWRALDEAIQALGDGGGSDVRAYLLRLAQAFVRWSVEHPAYSQLMFWRPVPGFEPSSVAYEPAVRVMQQGRETFAALQQQGALRADADLDELLRAWTALIAGVISQQLANAPRESFAAGRFTTLLPQLVQMYVSHYGLDRGGEDVS
jgi:AcrR family transcriptional regulator